MAALTLSKAAIHSSCSAITGSPLPNFGTQGQDQRRPGVLLKVEAKKGGGEEKKEKKEREKTSLFTSITDALDFAQARSEKDAELLDDARTATKMGEKMSREQYGALRRKIGGTYKDFFKDSIDVVGDYVEDGWVDKKCRYCKKDTGSEPRTVDNMGRYAHVACMEKAKSGNFFSRLFGR
ncbi:hypothetical protein R1sor_005260 [Riccia sorocarpa]|uniref:GATA-type transcription activator N-terminal domain-containing protein n=1 Tax=Riccia sorocarpa TaxID=122646 RepID=A0ABD3HQK1_9MARC